MLLTSHFICFSFTYMPQYYFLFLIALQLTFHFLKFRRTSPDKHVMLLMMNYARAIKCKICKWHTIVISL